MKAKVRVLVCDDWAPIRAHVRDTLSMLPELEVVGEAAGGAAGVKLALQLMPDIVVMDLSMPDLDGIQATRQILVAAPHIKVLFFSTAADRQSVQQALAAGAAGYLVKRGNPAELIRALQTVMEGTCYLSPELSGRRPSAKLSTGSLRVGTGPAKQQSHNQRGARQIHGRTESCGEHSLHRNKNSGYCATELPARKMVRVLLVDEAAFVRERLADLLTTSEGVEVVGQAGTTRAGIQLLQDLQPDVVVLDLDLPDQSGLALLGAIRKHSPTAIIMVLANYEHPAVRRRCAEMGADFYFYKLNEFEKVAGVCQDLVRQTAEKGVSR